MEMAKFATDHEIMARSQLRENKENSASTMALEDHQRRQQQQRQMQHPGSNPVAIPVGIFLCL